MKALVVFASKRGGTREIAGMIGEALTQRGIEADVVEAGRTVSLAGYDAAVIGSGLYAARWLRPARRFVVRNATALQHIPVWLFSSGPLDDSASRHEIPSVRQVQSLVHLVDAKGHATFGGRLASDAKGFPAAAMAKKNAGDWRDRDQIAQWSHDIADTVLRTLVDSDPR